MKPIQVANLDDAVARMNKAKKNRDHQEFQDAKEGLRSTLGAIENSDRETYNQYVRYFDCEFD